MKHHNNSRPAIRLPLYVSIAIVIGLYIGSQLGTGPTNSSVGGEVSKFRQVITYIKTDYVDDVESEDLVETAIGNMMKQLDPHSVYYPAEEHEIMGAQLDDNFEGIGVEFNIFRDTIVVLTVISGGPSQKVGMQNGDKIIAADGKNLTGNIRTLDVVKTLRGAKGTPVELVIFRKGQSIQLTVIRDEIPQYSLDAAYMLADDVGYIKLNRFAATTHEEFMRAYQKLEKRGMEDLILDLTGNLGGYMDQALNILDEFIADDKLLLYTKGKERRYNERHRARRKGVFEKGELVILIDEGSASAAEIVAGTVQDHDRGWIVGRRSFGKGLVQRTVEFNDGSAMRLTISRYYTPSGRSIQKPYEKGKLDAYFEEALQRYESGEMYSIDSIEISDSLVYRTSGGRKVYGGGGILPDFYVPVDTGNSSSYLNELLSRGILNAYGLAYAEAQRQALEAMSLKAFANDFQVTSDMVNQLIRRANQEGITYSEKAYRKSASVIKRYLKAFIARSIWNQEGFYLVWNKNDQIVQQGLSVLKKGSVLTVQLTE